MNFASWNIRGANRPFKQSEVRSLVSRHKVSLVALNETRVHEANHQVIIKAMLPGWKFITNYSEHPNGRIWVMWDQTTADIQPYLITDQLIHVRVTVIQLQRTFEISFIYGHNTYTQRRDLWHSLRSLSNTMLSRP